MKLVSICHNTLIHLELPTALTDIICNYAQPTCYTCGAIYNHCVSFRDVPCTSTIAREYGGCSFECDYALANCKATQAPGSTRMIIPPPIPKSRAG